MRLLISLITIGLAACSVPWPLSGAESDKGTVAIGSRVEMFVDDWLIDSSRSRGNVSFQLQTPARREIVLVTDKPWEGPDSAYFTAFQDGPLVRLISMYISEHYEWPDNRLRRITVRRHGFASVHTGASGGEFITRPVTFTGRNLMDADLFALRTGVLQ
jgi:hypothetical protein